MIRQTYVLYKREVLKMVRSWYTWAMLVAQPVIWLVFFGSSLSGLPRALSARLFGVGDYLSYLLPGMVSLLVVFMGLFASASLVFDKRVGYLKRVLVTPTLRTAILLAKSLGAATRALAMVPALVAVGVALGADMNVNPVSLLVWLASLVVAGVGFSALFIAMTAGASDPHAPMVVNNFVTMPLVFTSTALFPSQLFPQWLKAVSAVNPITYLTELGRAALIYGAYPDPTQLLALILFSAASLTIGVAAVEKALTVD